MKIKLWGVRGSLPCPDLPQDLNARNLKLLKDFISHGKDPETFLKSVPKGHHEGFGGNTSCVQVSSKSGTIIIDAGSGIKNLGSQLLAGPLGKGQGEAHIFMTHFHWDHLIGLPFFTPIFIPGNKINFYGVQPDLEEAIKSLFRRPFFPVEYSQLASKIVFHKLTPRKKIECEGLSITPYQLDHPDPCWGYRVEENGKAFAYCVDTECTRATPGELGEDLALYQGADVMVFDAQYTLAEVLDKANWGHAVASFGLDIALREKIKKVVFVHHDPYASIERIFAAQEQTRWYHQLRIDEARDSSKQLFDVDWEFGQEGMEIDL